MKKTLLITCLCFIFMQAGYSASVENSLNSFRDAFVKSGFIFSRAERKESGANKEVTYFYQALIGNARLEAKQVIFNADRIFFVYYLKGRALHFTHPFEIYAEGNVVITPGKGYKKGPKVFLMADALYYDGRTLQGLAVNSRVRATNLAGKGKQNVPEQLGFIARELRFKGKVERLKKISKKTGVVFNFFEGRDVTVSPCDFSSPHWGLNCGSIQAVKEDGKDSYRITTKDQYLAVKGHNILPLPPISVSTDLFKGIPLRRVKVISSRKFGYGVRTSWDLIQAFGLESQFKKLEDKTGLPMEVDGEIDALSKRGAGLGTQVRYGLKPYKWKAGGSFKNISNDFRLYGIHDLGEDRNEDELVGGYTGDDWRKKDRYRLRYFGRARLPVIGSLNAEVGLWRDRNFYKEFFERELYDGRTPDTYLQWRREFSDTFVTSVLFRPRVNPFQDYNESLPEGRIMMLPRHFTDYSFGPTVQAEVRAGNLRFQPDTLNRGTGSFRTKRYHGEGTFAFPLGISRYVRFRPLYTIDTTKYTQRWQGERGSDRLVQTAGISASTQIWRNFRLNTPLFDSGVLKHVVIPQVSYHNSFYSNQDHEKYYQFDKIDALDKMEYLELTLATYLLAKTVKGEPGTNPTIDRLLELRARVRYFPQAARDHRHGDLASGKPDKFSNVYLDLYSDIFHKNLTVGIESQVDTERGKGFSVIDPYLSYHAKPYLTLSMGQLFITGDRSLSRAEGNYFWGDIAWVISPLYTVRSHCQYDFARGTLGEERFSIARSFHCFTLVGAIEVDNGDNEVKYMINLYPSGFSSFNKGLE